MSSEFALGSEIFDSSADLPIHAMLSTATTHFERYSADQLPCFVCSIMLICHRISTKRKFLLKAVQLQQSRIPID